MMTEPQIAAIVDAVVRSYPSVQAIYLFGSHETEGALPESDVDIAVLLPPDAAKRERLMKISECRRQLERDLRKEIDLINLRLAPTVFQFQVVTTGRTIHIGDKRAVSEFEMLAFSLYQKLNEERRDILADFLRTGRAYGV